MKRITLETTEDKRSALENLLKNDGLTITEWFNDRIEEAVEGPKTYYQRTKNDLNDLSELENSSTLLENLKSVDWSFTSADTSYLSHNIHPYPAKYIPQIPNQLIRMLSLHGEKVWDPFGGSGTTALESILLGRQALSTDINPISEIIGRAKCTTLTQEQKEIISSFSEKIQILSKDNLSFEETFKVNEKFISKVCPKIPNQEKWFNNSVWKELGYVKWKISVVEDEKIKNILLAAFSKIIIRVSNQDSETRYVSKPKPVNPGLVLKLFSNEIQKLLPKISKLGNYLKFREPDFLTTDLRFEDTIQKNSIDLIVTSPPYPNATDYHLYHRFRIFWLDFDPVALGKCEIGSHLRHQKEANGIERYLEEMKLALNNMHNALRPGRYAVLVLGDAIFNKQNYDTAKLVGEEAVEVGFEFTGIFTRKLHSTKRSFSNAARRLREEKFLVIRKKAEKQKFTIFPPHYKLWPYEEEIQKLEIKSLLNTSRIVSESDGSKVIEVGALEIDQLRRLTFSHSFQAKNYSKENTWQFTVENGEALKSKRKDPKYATHGIHDYKGKFYPQLAKSLFNLANLKPNQNILDPFCGSGTVLLEAYLNGLNATGLDLNPIALKIAEAKSNILKLDSNLVDFLLSNFIKKIKSAEPIKDYQEFFDNDALDELQSWFPKKVLSKLAAISSELNEVPNFEVQKFIEVCLSSIVRNISQQDPKDLRIRRRKDPISDAPVFELFLDKLLEQRNRLRTFAENSNKASIPFGTTNVIKGDCRHIRSILNGPEKETIDCVVTSPPYATALPYVDTDRLSILLLFSMLSKERKQIENTLVGAREILKSEKTELEGKIQEGKFDSIHSKTAIRIIEKVYHLNEKAEVGFRKKNTASLLYRYYEDMTMVMKSIDWSVKKGGDIFIVIGDTKTYSGNENKEVIIKSCKALREIGESLNWDHRRTIPITVTQENRNHNKNSILENDILWFKKKL